MDQLLEELLLKRKDGLFKLIQEKIDIIDSNIKWAISGPKLAREILVKSLQLAVVVNQLKQHVQEFEPSPRLLDDQLSQFIPQLIADYESNSRVQHHGINIELGRHLSRYIAEVIYQFSQVRGFKHITYYFPSDIYKLRKLIEWFKQSDLVSDNEQFLILMWLCNLVMVPFVLETVTENASIEIYRLTLEKLQKFPHGSKNQLVALMLLSRLLSRYDQSKLLTEYCTDFQQHWNSNRLGNMLIMNKLMKRIPKLEARVVDVVLLNMFDDSYNVEQCSTSEIVYIIKLINRSCQAYFQERLIPYYSISGMIDSLFKKVLRPLFILGQCDINIRYAAAKSLAQIATTLSHYASNYFDQLVQFVIDELDLPKIPNTFKEDLKIDFEVESIAKYQTVILFLGYLGFMHALPSSYVPQICSITHQTLFFKQRNLNVMIGSQVRDSSCFVLWAIFKALKKEEFTQVFAVETRQCILYDLIKTTLYDEETVIRRCALAVLQEYVGRFGGHIFNVSDPKELGALVIKFIELFDMSSISTLKNSFAVTGKLQKLGFDADVIIVPHLLDLIECDDVLFKIKKLASETINEVYTTHLQEFTIGWEFQNVRPWTIERVASRLLRSFKSQNLGSLYALSSVAIAVHDGSCDKEMICAKQFLRQNPFQINQHNKNIHNILEELIFFYFAYLNTNEPDDEFIDHLWTLLFEVFGLSYSSQITSKLKILLDVTGEEFFNQEVQERIIHFMKNESMILAEVVGHLHVSEDYFIDQILPLVESVHIHAEVRAKLVNSISYYSVNNGISNDFIGLMIRLLDDYTVTVQGDVGSKVRSAAMDFFMKVKPQKSMLHDLMRKIARISCEPIEKLRIQARSLLSSLNDLVVTDSMTETISQSFFSAITSSRNANVEYYDIMLGYVVSLAGNSDTVTMNGAAYGLLEYIETSEENDKIKLFDSMLGMLQVPLAGIKQLNRREKLILKATLRTFTILFDFKAPFPSNFNYDRLYARCYNLHINTNDSQRVTFAVKIFRDLIISGVTARENAAKRLSFLCCNHKEPRIRKASSEAIFEIIEDRGAWDEKTKSLIIDTDWGDVTHNGLEPLITKILLQ